LPGLRNGLIVAPVPSIDSALPSAVLRASAEPRLAIHTGIALFASEPVRAAALPLFEAGEIDAIEWTFDHGWSTELPDWVSALLEAYAAEDRLCGHGVRLSPTSARFDDASRSWLARLAEDRRRCRHVTEHWGFSRARGLAHGAPMPLVASEAVVAATVRALRELAAVAGVPVGVENLALALSEGELATQPAMIARVLAEIDGVLLLDAHNLWCQAINYGRDPRELALHYPLARVRQLHVAGGRWSESTFGPPFRRDTHDALAPAEVIELVAWLVPRCPALEVVILERLPEGLADEPAREQWRDEFRALAATVRDAAEQPAIAVQQPPLERFSEHSEDQLARFQDAMIATLLDGGDLLAHPDAAPFRDEVARWEPRAVEVAAALTARWGVRG
jgi:uncharacterized protein (UPF0276 family)